MKVFDLVVIFECLVVKMEHLVVILSGLVVKNSGLVVKNSGLVVKNSGLVVIVKLWKWQRKVSPLEKAFGFRQKPVIY